MDVDDEQVRDVYAHFGLAVYLAQVFEFGVVIALVTLRLPQKDMLSVRDIDDFMEGRFQRTLGALLKQLRKETTLPTGLAGTLSEALKRRNFLVHGYFRARAIEFETRKGRVQMLSELQTEQQLFRRADQQLVAALTPLRAKYGITDSAIDDCLTEMFSGLEFTR